MRLTDVDEAIINFGFEWDDIPPTREEFVRFLKKQSIIDAVPVVRCLECKHYDPENHHCDHYMGTSAPLRRKPDDFCSYGERKEGADNELYKKNETKK